MKLITVIFSLLILSGCEMTSKEYSYIRGLCEERKGTYFIVTVPTIIGTRLGVGCLETSTN